MTLITAIQSFKLSDIEIRPQGYIYIALNKILKQTDILVPSSFKFTFAQNEKLFLADNYGQKIQIFPMSNIHRRLDDFTQCPLKATPFGNDNTPIRGVIIENITGKNIALIAMSLTNQRATFNKIIPHQQFKTNTKLRLICTKNDNRYISQILPNDIIIRNDQVNHDNDSLLIRDMYGKQFELYRYDHSDNHNNNNNNIDSTSCFVM